MVKPKLVSNVTTNGFSTESGSKELSRDGDFVSLATTVAVAPDGCATRLGIIAGSAGSDGDRDVPTTSCELRKEATDESPFEACLPIGGTCELGTELLIEFTDSFIASTTLGLNVRSQSS